MSGPHSSLWDVNSRNPMAPMTPRIGSARVGSKPLVYLIRPGSDFRGDRIRCDTGNRQGRVVVVQYRPDSRLWEHQYRQNRVCHVTEEAGSGGWGLRSQQQRPGRQKVQAGQHFWYQDHRTVLGVQTESLSTRLILAISLGIDLWKWSNSSSWDERKHGREPRRGTTERNRGYIA